MGIKMNDKVYAGFSLQDSISFIIDGYVVSSIRENNGGTYRAVFERPNKNKKKMALKDWAFSIIITILGTIISLSLQFLSFVLLGSMSMVFAFETVTFILVALSLGATVKVFEKEDYSLVALHHGAEHKVYNAAVKLGRLPSLSEARKATRFCPWCGVKAFSFSLFFFGINIVLTLFGFPALPLALISFLTSVLPAYDPITYVIQKRVTTKEPNDEQLRLALEAYTAAYEISQGREICSDEFPTDIKSYMLITEIENTFEDRGRLTSEQIEKLEMYAERLRKENNIIENVVAGLV